jgi:hypothetical protein
MFSQFLLLHVQTTKITAYLQYDLAKANRLLTASRFPLQIYTSISNKVVGVLLRARKHKFVDFEGETLFQAS